MKRLISSSRTVIAVMFTQQPSRGGKKTSYLVVFPELRKSSWGLRGKEVPRGSSCGARLTGYRAAQESQNGEDREGQHVFPVAELNIPTES
jgi:hypothetical protein